MTTPSREKLAKKLLQQQEALGSGGGMKKRRHTSTHPPRGHRLQQLPSPTEQQLQQRESGWNDRFFYETPVNSNKLPRPERITDNVPKPPPPAAAVAQHKKEKKIRDERLQYGNSEIKRKTKESKQSTHGRLMPLDFFPEPTLEAKLHSSKEEKLRIKALKAIDTRENLLYQLNALILCTPVQEALFQPSRPSDPPSSSSHGFQRMRAKAGMALAPTPASRSGNSGPMTNAREATKMAQKLAEDLQLAGIQCVEAMVEWMLEAGAKAEKPPPFLWRDRNYFMKMHQDLDFAQPELEARGVHLECFTQQNPLLIRTSQKLGRVLAAQAIITEMVELAPARKPVHEPVDHGFEKREDIDSNNADAYEPESPTQEPQDQEPSSFAEKATDISHEEESADVMVQNTAEDEESGESASEQNEPGYDEEEQEDEHDSDQVESEIKSPITKGHGVDPSSAEELVSILDESLSDWKNPTQSIFSEPASDEPDALTVVTSRENESSASEYDNSFEDDAGEKREEENQDCHDVTEEAAAAITSSSEAVVDDVEKAAAPEVSEPDSTEEEPPTSPDEDNQSLALDDAEQIDSDSSPIAPGSEKLESEKRNEHLLDELRRLAEAEELEAIGIQAAQLEECASWNGDSEIATALSRQEPLDTALTSSFYSVLAQFQFSPSTTQTEELLQTPVAKDARLSSCLWHECLCIADNVYGYLASQIQLAFERGNSLISEIEIEEAIELTEGTFIGIHKTTWAHLRTAVGLLKLIHSIGLTDPEDKSTRTSSGVSSLVKVFYPYLVNLSREKLSSSWQRIAQVFGSISPDLGVLAFLMDPTCKALLLAANVGSSSALKDSESEKDSTAFPKLTVVCERGNVLESSITALWPKVFATSAPESQFVLYPFFQSAFGEKVVDGKRVEEGEGRGPLKEWITLVSSEITAKWKDVAIDLSFHGNASVEANGNKFIVAGFAHSLQPGYEVSWRSDDAETVSRIVNKIVDQDTVLLDRGVSVHSFPVSELKVRQPRQAFFEYVKASESFWLSSQTQDTPENRKSLRFYGWYLATAVSHYSKIDLQLHPLLFSLLLDEKYRVTLEDVKSLDSTLFDSLIQMKKMPRADFAAFLELESGDSSLSVDEYILQAVDEKFGARSSICWQSLELRTGFRSVFSQDELGSAGIGAADLAEVICGKVEGGALAQDSDFNIDEIFRVALDPDFVKCLPLRRVFWRQVNAFEPQMKRKFVKFVTGVDTLPLPGTEFLRIEMPFAVLTPAENQKILLMLPQSHTCDNTLELPNYWRALCWKAGHDDHEDNEALEEELAVLLAKKLCDAVEYSSGYGLDGTSAVAGVLSEKSGMRAGSSTSRGEESYESLDLPGMADEGEQSASDTARAQTAESSLPMPQEQLTVRDESVDGDPDEPVSTISETADAEAETAARSESSRSPKKSARQQQKNVAAAEESFDYGENEWEEDEELLD